VVIPPQFANAYPFSEGLAVVNIGGGWVTEKTEHGSTTAFKGGQWGYIDARGKVVINTNAGEVASFSEGLAAVRTGDKWGYIDRSGKMVIAPQFAIGDSFSDGRARVSLIKGDEESEERPVFGYIDRTGRMVIPPKFLIAKSFSNGLAVVVANDPVKEHWKADWGLIDPDGKFVVEPKYDWALDFSDGVAAVYTRDQRIEYVDRTGKTVCVACGLDGKPLVAEGMGIPWRGHKEEALEFHEGVARFRIGAQEIHVYVTGKADLRQHGFYFERGQWGFIDKTGKGVITPRFSNVHDFSEGLAAVQLRDKWGFVDPTGKMVIEPQFDYAYGFWNGLSRVEVGIESPKIGYIDRTGKYIWPPTR